MQWHGAFGLIRSPNMQSGLTITVLHVSLLVLVVIITVVVSIGVMVGNALAAVIEVDASRTVVVR